MDSVNTYWADRALLEWQVELGVTDAICDAPVNRYALEIVAPVPEAKAVAPVVPVVPDGPPTVPTQAIVDALGDARRMAAAADGIASLCAAITAFPYCDLKRGARTTVIAVGSPAARVMFIGDAPNRAEDRAGTPFAGEEGQLLDKMLAAIGLARDAQDAANGAYLVAALPWRVPSDGPPDRADVAMMQPFLERHITIAQPEVLVLMGNTGLQMLTGQSGLTRLRGQWLEVLGRPAMPMMHPAHLLRSPAAKREAWADLLALKAKLREMA